jgi:polysaccharide biosynthesis protein PelA
VRRAACVAALLVLASVTACGGSPPAPRSVSLHTVRTTQLEAATDFVVYYGAGELDALSRYDLAIIDPSTLNRDEITELRSRGTLVVGYLSVGEIEAHDPWLVDGTVPHSWILGRNRNWGSLFVDASQPGWQELMRDRAVELVEEYGFDGVFLDTVDTAIDVAPETGPGMVELIQGLRNAEPDALLIQNRGFDLLPDTQGTIDGVMFEDLSTTYDFEANTYERIEPDPSVTSDLQARHDETGLPVLALDYAEPSDAATIARAVRIARGFGFIPAVTVIALDEVPAPPDA